MKYMIFITLITLSLVVFIACEGPVGIDGPQGQQGLQGEKGDVGATGNMAL